MNDHVTNQKNPHKVTAEQVGAASSVHSHTIDQVEGLNTALSNKADLGGPKWFNLTLADEFKPTDGPSIYNRYSLDQFGRVTVQFNLTTKTLLNVENNTAISTLPEGFRPERNQRLFFSSYDGQRGKPIIISVAENNGTISAFSTSSDGFTSITAEITFMSGS